MTLQEVLKSRRLFKRSSCVSCWNSAIMERSDDNGIFYLDESGNKSGLLVCIEDILATDFITKEI